MHIPPHIAESTSLIHPLPASILYCFGEMIESLHPPTLGRQCVFGRDIPKADQKDAQALYQMIISEQLLSEY